MGLGATGGGVFFFLVDVLPAKLMTESKMSSISFCASLAGLRLPPLVLSLMLAEELDALAAGGGGGGGGGAPPAAGAGGGGGGGAAAWLLAGAPAPPPLVIPSSAKSWSVSNSRSAIISIERSRLLLTSEHTQVNFYTAVLSCAAPKAFLV